MTWATTKEMTIGEFRKMFAEMIQFDHPTIIIRIEASAPDWETLIPSDWGVRPRVTLVAEMRVARDSRGQMVIPPGATAVVHIREVVPPLPAAKMRTYLPNLVRQVASRAVLHEIDEWLRVDGELLNDPHADGYDRAPRW